MSQGYISVPRILLASLPPDLDRLDAMDARRVLFLRALLPVVLHVNAQIGADRQRLLGIRARMNRGEDAVGDDVQWILSLADAYDQPDADVDILLKKVDVIPPSLALAQAIEESGWGTSRIAREQNAIFGQFGQGISGDWDYRNFASLTEAVAAYARNLNTHRAYREFRLSRARMRLTRGEIDAGGNWPGPCTAIPSAATIMWSVCARSSATIPLSLSIRPGSICGAWRRSWRAIEAPFAALGRAVSGQQRPGQDAVAEQGIAGGVEQ